MQVLIADDHPLFRDALSAAINRVLPKAKVIHASCLKDAFREVASETIDLVLLDLHMPDSEGFAGLIALRHDFPALPVVVVSASTGDSVVGRALTFGAAGYIPKSTPLDEICVALDAVLAGDIWMPAGISEPLKTDTVSEKLASLTPAQLKVLLGIRAGQLNKQIAYDLQISEATVKAHVTAIFRKLDVINRTQAVLLAEKLDVERPQVMA